MTCLPEDIDGLEAARRLYDFSDPDLKQRVEEALRALARREEKRRRLPAEAAR